MRLYAKLAEASKYLALTGICVLAFSIRLFSIIKYESVIHEFDPYFNYRVTQFLTKEGFYEMWNWFDDRTWYPLGRVIGGTVYPGLIFTAGSIYRILHFFHIPIHVQEVCVLTAPLFSAFCALACYGLVSQARSHGAGLLAAFFVAVVPSYISRSVAGSFDNEGVAIFALVNVFYWFLKTVNTGSLADAVVLVASYGYMVMSWGGYSFIINLLPLYCLACIFFGRLNGRLYVAFAPLVALGTAISCSIPVVGFNAVLMSEHFGAFFAFVVLHLALLVSYVRRMLSTKHFLILTSMVLTAALAVGAVVASMVVAYVAKSPTLGWTGRSMTLLDPTYASRFVPIIASVSEHQPPQWTSYIMDLHVLVMLAPAGILACFHRLTDASLFLVLYGLTAVYFSGVMIRLMLVLAPAVCCLSAVALSDLMYVLCGSLRPPTFSRADKEASTADGDGAVSGSSPSKEAAAAVAPTEESTPSKKKSRPRPSSSIGSGAKLYALPAVVCVALLSMVLVLLGMYVVHCIHASADMYSSPSIVLQSPRPNGGFYVFDDFREAYAWLRHNTHPDAKASPILRYPSSPVASWWDYGYQTTAMANRTVIVDNNTWNTSHIATVGRAMSSSEAKAWSIYRSLDVDYVFVVFGGLVGYPSDDINKFLWMVRIGGGVYPEIKEPDYLTPEGDYRVDARGTKTMLNSLMYKLSYYNFADESQLSTGQRGVDRVRGYPIGRLNVKLNYFEEVFTSQHWMMRIYRVRDRPLRDPTSRVSKKGKTASRQG
ncbi:hypothetical protein VOLCADRAFT_66117 [Volvox carteri f. nagariensis]|uniref:dolichyl-diphosphooligosaccharide--protein glycotransferase n=1 Tax=Volvox carteri f. nagariensis TaxID=3068 RepID=D8UAL7_VOLCA|nr:uncharacterized protein VOLCADRAFT_66117 [Volvox carteri f. nagariensis]EFJ43283.1 hypothetical protein VOLCADRAFT_66117 [Volvox carteri f. nagariensis]|eukprot:XP_002955643.1 hypothetical protein VOLCADRAFT_66117 [Volvox carteri f. nagariensis]